MRDHNPTTIEEFNGLWARGGSTIGTSYTMDSCPKDHFSDCNNVEYIESGFQTRNGIDVFPTPALSTSFPNALKVKNYPKVASESLLVLDTGGNIFDTGSPTPGVAILTIVGMQDFGLAFYAGRAYISPSTLVHGMAGEKVYVYKGDGSLARKAAGQPPKDVDGVMTAAAGAAGHTEKGIHVFAVVYETDTGFLTQIGPDTLNILNASGATKVNLATIPVSPNSYVVNKRIVTTKAIDPTLYTGNTKGYQFFFIPGAVITNATTTLTVDFYDSELLEDASHLLDLFAEIPAGVGLTIYNNRLIDWTQEPNAEQSDILVSYPGEPEAVDQVNGLIQLQANDEPITICQEVRGSLYIFKYVETYAVTDNGGTPDTWGTPLKLDQGIGAALHGIATTLDTGGVSVDYAITASFSGIFLFIGSFKFPELSYKIADLWDSQSFADFQRIEIYNDTILKRLYVIMPNQQILLMGDYQKGLDSMKIRWAKWTAPYTINSICLTQFNKLIIAAGANI